MPFKTRPKELMSYYNALQRCTTHIVCPRCNASLLPKHFENHCRVHHNFETKTGCVWCQRVTWPLNEKHKYGQHLSNCFHNSFLPHRLLDLTHPFREKDFFGHAMTHPIPMFDIEELLNAPASPLPTEILPPLPIPFEDDNLNLAASCVLLYLSDTFDFFHVMIKLVVFESFLEAMRQDNSSYTLPFSCWCDGGAYPEPEYRQHRHAIVISPKNYFRRRVWPKIKLPSGTPKPNNFPCKKIKAITSPLYLVNVIGYLSQRKSRCNFSFNESDRTQQNNHFYLYKTLPVDFKLHLALLWDGGVSQLLYQTKFQNISIELLAQGNLTHDGRRWTQKIKDFYGHEKGLVVRVARDYVPTRKVTPHFLHLVEGRKLYFEKLPEKLEHALWLRKQIEGGNRFYDAVEESTWIPRKRDQKVLNFYKPVLDRNRELESRVAELEESNRELDRENKSLYIKMQHFTDQILRYKDEENARLVHENTTLKQEIERLNNLVQGLNGEH